LTKAYWVCASEKVSEFTDPMPGYPDPEKELVSLEFHQLIRGVRIE
jgi:hypothetical protein